MIVAVPKETYPDERRVALVPVDMPGLVKAGLTVLVQKDAGTPAGHPDEEYRAKGAQIIADRAELFSKADVLLMVRTPTDESDIGMLKSGQAVIGFSDPLGSPKIAETIASRGAALLSMELIPRITRAQSMDALSSMATVAGYKAVLTAANALPKMFPMMMTAAGTIAPARVFIIGAGVAGLMAIAQARKLGAVVEAYDVRPAVKEQVQSLGAKFVEMELESGEAEDSGGYAKELGEDFYKKQRELMARVVAESDVVVTTAAIPGKKAPVLITADMVRSMRPGSVIVDLAAATGGNCELTEADKIVDVNGTIIFGHTNLPSEVPRDASRMYSKNITNLLLHLVEDGAMPLNMEDEITAGTLVCRDGKVVHARVLEALARA